MEQSPFAQYRPRLITPDLARFFIVLDAVGDVLADWMRGLPMEFGKRGLPVFHTESGKEILMAEAIDGIISWLEMWDKRFNKSIPLVGLRDVCEAIRRSEMPPREAMHRARQHIPRIKRRLRVYTNKSIRDLVDAVRVQRFLVGRIRDVALKMYEDSRYGLADARTDGQKEMTT